MKGKLFDSLTIPEMDIHRCRFVPYPPASINAVAFSHPSESHKKATPESLRVALGRSNGDIEIWNPLKGSWLQETILRGGKDRSIEGLAWTQDIEDGDTSAGGRLRLFSIGYSSSVTEWDLERGTTLRHANGNYGEIWCFAAQPTSDSKDKAAQTSHSKSQYLAAGCADGNILLFSTSDGELQFSKVLGAPPTKKPRVLSIAWKNRHVIVAGYSDGTIRLFDIRSKKLLRNISLGKPGDGSNDILVWAVKCLVDETIVSGDSTGEIKIWDAHNYSLVQRLQAHQADVLDISSSVDGEMIISGGADRRTVAFRRTGPKKAGKGRRWAEVMHRRFHRHDVKALAAYESSGLSILLSGGLDTVPIVTPLREWQGEYHRSLSNLPRSPQICSAPAVRLLVSWWEREISIWHVNSSSETVDDPGLVDLPKQERYRLATKILLNSDENITSVHISVDGTALAVSTAVSVKIFSLRLKSLAGRTVLKVRTVPLSPVSERTGARLVQFSPDVRWLALVRTDSKIVIKKLIHPSETKKYLTLHPKTIHLSRPRRQNRTQNSLGHYGRSILSGTFSSDSRIFTVGDIAGNIDSWLLEGQEEVLDSAFTANGVPEFEANSSSDDDSSDDEAEPALVHNQRWVQSPLVLPNLGSPILILTFRTLQRPTSIPGNGDAGMHSTRRNPHPHSYEIPIQDDRLVAITAHHQIVEFQVTQGRLSDWSRRNTVAHLPEPFTVIKDRVMGSLWDVRDTHERLYLYGTSWIFMVDMTKDLPEREVVGKLGRHEVTKPAESVLGKRKWSSERKHNSGAGDTMPVSQTYIGMNKTFLKYAGNSSLGRTVQTLGLGNQVHSESEDQDDDALKSHLAGLRRKVVLTDEAARTDGQSKLVDGVDEEAIGTVSDPNEEPSRVWWHSHTYRSVLGIVMIGEVQNIGSGANPEIAIVERPLWDLDLPPRYDED